MIPLSGRHQLVEQPFTGGSEGIHEGTREHDKGIGLARQGVAFVPVGVYTSDPLDTGFPCNEMVLTWNGIAPNNTTLHAEFRIRGKNSDWSGWFQMGAWKSEVSHQRRTSDAEYGDLDVDHFKAARYFNEVQYRVKFRTADQSQSPLLRAVFLCISETEQNETVVIEDFSGAACDLDVPWISQYDPDAVKDKVLIDAGVCAATSVTMVLRYHGLPANVRDIGRRAYDPTAKIYGNWAFLCAAASELGPTARVERFCDWRPLEELVAAGIPPVISIAYPPGTFSEEPDKETSGHLLVVRGFDSSGNVIVNDPGTTDESRGRAYVYPRDELARAFFGHGGVSIIIRK